MNAALLVKATLLFSSALLVARLLRTAPAVSRHRLWSLAFTAVLVLPLLTSVLPALELPVPLDWSVPRSAMSRIQTISAQNDVSVRTDSGRDHGDPSRLTGSAEPRGGGSLEHATGLADASRESQSSGNLRFRAFRAWPSAAVVLVSVWITGATIGVALLLQSLLRVHRLADAAEDMTDPAWRSAADAVATQLGLGHAVRLLTSRGIATPMAGGIWRPVVFLPESARTWTVERRDVVLAHEIAHLAGRDPVRHLAARLAVAFYWFHPLAWFAAREATVAREQACDQMVVALGTRPSAYARVLLDLAHTVHHEQTALAALPMIERSLLETRLMAILNDDVRFTTGRRSLLPAIGVALLTLPVAAAQPVGSSATPSIASASIAASAVERAPATPTGPMAAKNVDAALASSAAIQAVTDSDSACWWDPYDRSSFRGSMSSSNAGGRIAIYEQVGTRGSDRVIQKSFGDLRLCMVAEGAGDRAETERPSQWLGRARRIVLEARRGNAVQRLEIRPDAGGGGRRTSWRVGGTERAFDAAAQRWRDRMLATLDTTWELSTLRGQVSSLRGQISSIHGQESSLRGEISSLRGEVSSMRGRASSVRGEESSLRGQISSIRGHVSSLRGAISSENGAISSLNGSRHWADASERTRINTQVAQHDAAIARIEREIRDYNADAKIVAVEREIQALEADGKVAAIDAAIRAFDLEGKVAAVERRISELDVRGRVAAIEHQIEALDADRRGRQLEERRDSELKELEAAIAAIR
jgi:beta-lactamase regulating signal transducer with metallopeptidase domain